MGLFSVIVFSTVVAIGQSQDCCMPAQWEGREAQTGGIVVNQKGELTQDFMDISYDGTNKKLSVISNSTVGKKQTATWVIQHFSEGVMYTIDLMTQKCVKGKLDIPMAPACVPDSAKKGEKVVYGGGSQRLQCETYTWRQSGQGVLLDMFLAVVKDGNVCYPVAEEAAGSANNVPLVETYGFVDITNGIKEPSIFNPPSYCNQVPMTHHTIKKGRRFLPLYL